MFVFIHTQVLTYFPCEPCHSKELKTDRSAINVGCDMMVKVLELTISMMNLDINGKTKC